MKHEPRQFFKYVRCGVRAFLFHTISCEHTLDKIKIKKKNYCIYILTTQSLYAQAHLMKEADNERKKCMKTKLTEYSCCSLSTTLSNRTWCKMMVNCQCEKYFRNLEHEKYFAKAIKWQSTRPSHNQNHTTPKKYATKDTWFSDRMNRVSVQLTTWHFPFYGNSRRRFISLPFSIRFSGKRESYRTVLQILYW